MQKGFLTLLTVLLGSLMVGCGGNKSEFHVDKIEVNTLYAKEDGTFYSATVEEFNKEHYMIDELRAFAQEEINEYLGSTDTTRMGVYELVTRDGNAILVLNYKDFNEYASFNEKEISIISSNDLDIVKVSLPSAYMNVKDGAYVESKKIFEKNTYNIAILNESIDFIVDGTVMYYENATIISDNHVQTGSKGRSFIVYKTK